MKLNIGSGKTVLEGFVNVDRKNGGEAYPLMIERCVVDSESVDEIYASHVLEHFSHRETLNVLREWLRVLKPNGLIRIAVPNIEYAASQIGKHPHAEGWIMGGHIDGDDKHGAIFNKQKLEMLMTEAGFDCINEFQPECEDCTRLPVSLNLQGRRSINAISNPKPIASGNRKVLAIMSVPRVGYLAPYGLIFESLMPHGITMKMHTGAFWEQQLSRCIQDAINEGFDDIITLDYDSIFSRSQFDLMYSTWLARPDIDALAPLQPQRGTGLSMFQPMNMPNAKPGDECRLELNLAEPMKVRTAHFGLTFLRLDKFKAMPKPWFWNKPSEKGTWYAEDGKIDADITFWLNWEKIGNNCYMLPGCNLGHIEELVAQIDFTTGRVCHRYMGDFRSNPLCQPKVEVRDKESK